MEMLSNKWVATVGMWIQCSSGVYTFSVYSSVLKSSQGYDQSTLETVAVFRDIGSSAGVLSGLQYTAVTHNNNYSGYFRGPWLVHLAGAIQGFFGYFLMWAAVVGLIERPRLPGCSGISGAILIQVYDTFYKGKPSTFLLMLAILPTFIQLVLMLLVKIYKTNTGDDKKHLNCFSAVVLIIAGYLMIIIILGNIFSLPLWAHIFTFILLLLLLASPLGIAIQAQKDDSKGLLETFSF
uniref:Nodulin-like domain-containing protein n=1 Tax=Quercus lobata TaxID=97700 RepID=A0A7N2MPX8_QUELO